MNEGSESRPDQRAEFKRALRASAVFVALCGILWASFLVVNRRLPYLQPGSDIVYRGKMDMLSQSDVLDLSKPVRVLIFGDSKVLAGFIPEYFEQELPGVSSYNCGLPAQKEFVKELTTLVNRGQIPTHVLIAVDWDDPVQRPVSFFHFVSSDRQVMENLFPFRHLLRDLSLFLLRSPHFGGIAQYYQHGREAMTLVQRNRGYYFIDSQSRFAGNRLPDDFTIMGDSSSVDYRAPATETASFAQLKGLSDRFGIKFLIVPYYRRMAERGAPGQNHQMVEALREYPSFRVLGDDYLRFPNRYFSDTGHLNPEGAKLYTSELARLMKEELIAEGRTVHNSLK